MPSTASGLEQEHAFDPTQALRKRFRQHRHRRRGPGLTQNNGLNREPAATVATRVTPAQNLKDSDLPRACAGD
jgi:hypothetical protein